MPAAGARMLSAFSDDMPELERQMGCMAGVLQVFDRQRMLTARRSGAAGRQPRKNLPPPAPAPPEGSCNVPVQSSDTSKIVLEETFSKTMTENSSLSMESSGASSSSSSSCSSFSSMDGTSVVSIDRSFKVPGNVVAEPSWRLREQSRFSCDDGRLLRLRPAETLEPKKISTRSRELPRLSLDSRKNCSYRRTDGALMDALKPQESPSHRRVSSSVVAKLMGLEEAPHATGTLAAGSCEPAGTPRPAPPSLCQDLRTPLIERRIAGIEFSEFNKNFRALRIVDALRAKDDAKLKNSGGNGASVAARRRERPARAAEKPGVSAAPHAGIRGRTKLQPREPSSFTCKAEASTSHARISKAPSMSDEPVSGAGSPRPAGSSSSPRLMQRKAEPERRSRRPPVSPKPPSKKPSEAAPPSPGGRGRSKPSQVKSRHENEVLQSPGRRISLAKQVDVSVMACQKKPRVVNLPFVQQGYYYSPPSTPMHKDLSSVLGSKHKIHSVENVASPVSVLGTSFYHKTISDSFKEQSRSRSQSQSQSQSTNDEAAAERSSEHGADRLRRRLVFDDLVNEAVAQKMSVCTPCEMKDWGSSGGELQGVVLDVERSIFRDLIDEVVGGEVTEKMQTGQWKLARQ